MKKMKFRKLSRVLISISLLAIIAVSLISVPVSAADNSVIGYWKLNPLELVGDFGSKSDRFSVAGFISVPSDASLSSFTTESITGFEISNTYTSGDYQFNNVVIYFGDGSSSAHINLFNYTVSYVGTQTFQVNVSDWVETDASIIELTSEATRTSGSGGFQLIHLLNSIGERYVPPQPRSLLDNILGTFSDVGSWIGTIISSLVALFWSVETASLTFLGILSVAGLAFSVIMLLFGIVSRFVGFSG